jgi:hypothetical protein
MDGIETRKNVKVGWLVGLAEWHHNFVEPQQSAPQLDML